MPGYFLTRIQIEGFRGINNVDDPLDLRFDPNQVISVFGQNGLGKSSIYDAIAFAVRGNVARLDGMHEDELAKQCYHNRFHSKGEATIKLTLRPDDGSADIEVQVQLPPSGVRSVTSPTGHSSPKELLKSLDNPFLLLDHKAFMSFVDDSPLNRGRTFSSLLGLGRLSEYRQALEVLARTQNLNTDFKLTQLEAEVKAAEASATQSTNGLRVMLKDFFGTDVEPTATDLKQRIVAALADVPLIKHLCDKPLESLDFKAIKQCISDAEKTPSRNKLAGDLAAKNALEGLVALPIEAEELADIANLVSRFEAAELLTRGPVVKRMLEAVAYLIDEAEVGSENVCPACEREPDYPLLPSVRERLQAYELVRSLAEEIRQKWNGASWAARLKKIESSPYLVILVKKHSQFEKGFTSAPSSELVSDVYSHLQDVAIRLHSAVQDRQTSISAIEATLPASLVELTTQVERASNLAKAIKERQDRLVTQYTKAAALAKRLKWQIFIGRAAQVFADAEARLSTSLTSALETQYQADYASITQNPSVVPVLKRAANSEDLSLRLSSFYGLSDVPAASLLPESYRNALGMAIFLSAARQKAAVARFVILDDVTSSFDSGHQFQLMELLRTSVSHPASPSGPQIILLSHDGLLEKYFDKQGGTSGWHHQKLQGLPPTAAVLGQTQQVDRLAAHARRLLSAGLIQTAEPLIRQYLEYSLLQIIRKVSIPVPFDFAIQADHQMVGNAIEAIKAAIALHKAAGTLILPSAEEAAVMGTLIPQLVANWVSHYSTGGTGALSAYVLQGVLDSIDNLRKCFKYQCNCNASPQERFYRSLSAKACKC